MAERPNSTTTAYFFKVMVFVALFSVAWQMLVSHLEARFVQRSVAGAEVEHTRAKFYALLDRDLDAMRVLAYEYGVWDETYAYAQSRDSAYIVANVLPTGDNPAQVDFYIFWDSDGAALYSQRIGAGAALTVDELAELQPLAFAMVAEQPENPSAGLALIRGEVFLLGLSPILRNDGSGPSRGVLLFARSLSKSLLDSYTTLMGGDLQSTISDRTATAALTLAAPSGSGFADWRIGEHVVGRVEVRRSSGLSSALASGEDWQLLANAIGTALLVTIGTLLVRRRMLAPLSELREQLNRIRAGDDRPVAVQSSLSEIDVVVAAINALIEEQARSHAARRDRDAAQAADRLKSMFLATMSHEIRTPLTGLIGALELASAADHSQEREHFLSIARNSSEHLMQLLDDVLDFSRIEADQLILHNQDVCLQAVVADAVSLMRPRAIAKGLSLQVDDGPPLMAQTDPVRVRQILVNLLSNAVKFSSSGAIEIVIRGAEGEAEIAVADRGIGIPAEKLDSIFDAFRQLRSEISHRHTGTGLGLAISRRLARALGGELTAHNRDGGGSRFVLRLAKVREAAPDASTVIGRRPANTAALRDKAILLADDDESIRSIIVSALSSLGARVAEAADGKQALELAERQRFDLILMDRHMPVMDGLEAARALRAGATPNRATPILAMTASTQAEDQQACLKAGMSRFVGKPIKLGDLADVVARELQ